MLVRLILCSLKGARIPYNAPGSFLINAVNGKVAFVHNGGDIVAASPDGSHVAIINGSSWPPYVNVARFDDDAPVLELHCSASEQRLPASLSFKGWRDDGTFDMVLSPKSGKAPGDSAVPLRMALAGGVWSIAAPDLSRLRESFGWSCKG